MSGAGLGFVGRWGAKKNAALRRRIRKTGQKARSYLILASLKYDFLARTEARTLRFVIFSSSSSAVLLRQYERSGYRRSREA